VPRRPVLSRPARGRTHHRFKSPHIASIVQSVIAAIIVLFAVFTGTNDPASQAYLQLYGLMAVMGVIIILSVQALVSLAFVVYLLFDNISFLGSGYSYAKWLGPSICSSW
jgi:amino acid transporter